MTSSFPPDSFRRQDESADTAFYDVPRLVNHIDDYAIAAVGEAYRRFLPPDGEYLDLMSSWVSHLPPDFPRRRLVGHGMNEVELGNNPALDSYFLQDLNLNPVLPFEDATFDGVVICVSVQYLTQPVAMFREIGRVLKPGCPLVVAFSNRCFPTKAVRIWTSLDDDGHARLIGAYAGEAGVFQSAEAFDFSPRRTFYSVPEDEKLREQIASGRMHSDPLYVVVAVKKDTEEASTPA